MISHFFMVFCVLINSSGIDLFDNPDININGLFLIGDTFINSTISFRGNVTNCKIYGQTFTKDIIVDNCIDAYLLSDGGGYQSVLSSNRIEQQIINKSIIIFRQMFEEQEQLINDIKDNEKKA